MKDRMKLLTDAEVEKIHDMALDMLETMGMKFDNDEACEYFKKAGATVEGRICKIPRKVIEEALKTVPTRDNFVLYGRTPDKDWRVEDHKPSLHQMTMAVKVIDPVDGRVRPATNDDLAKMTTLLEHLDCYSAASAPITPQDVPSAGADWYTWATSIKYTTKHITGGCVGKQGVYDAAKMGAIALGSMEEFKKRPFLSVWALTSPPLMAEENMCNTLMATAEMGMVNVITSGGITGLSSPICCESALVHTHAETMACIALTQLVNPGAPVIYSSFVRSIDMQSMAVGMGSPESNLMRGCMCQLGRYLNLPTQVPTLCRDAKILDAQAGFETGFGGLVGAMCADYVISSQLDSDLIVDYADFPFTNEAMEQIQRFLRPLDFSEDHMCMEDFEETGINGSFLDCDSTALNFRKELWTPTITERDNHRNWEKKGSKSIREKGLDMAMAMLEKYGNEPLLTPEQCKAIDEIADASVDKTSRTNQK